MNARRARERRAGGHPQRRFPTLAEVDEWLAVHLIKDTQNGNPVIDQLKAAGDEINARMRAVGPGLVADGQARWAFLDSDAEPGDHSRLRGIARQVMAAQSAGIRSMCPHTYQVRPLLLCCDPPVVVCFGCLPSQLDRITSIGHLWDHECDRCGAQSEMVAASTGTGLGHVTVTGHLCGRCTSEDRQLAAQLADRVVVVHRGRRP